MDMKETTSAELTIIDKIKERNAIIIGAVGIFIVLGGLYILLRPPAFESVATIVLQQPGALGLGGTDPTFRPDRYVADQLVILNSDPVATRSLQQLGEDVSPRAVSDFKESLRTSNEPDSNIVTVSYSGTDAQSAQLSANAVVGSYQAIVQAEAESQFSGSTDALDTRLALIDIEIDNLADEISALAAQETNTVDQEYAQALNRLAELQESRPNLSEDELEGFRAELTDLLTFLEAVRAVRSLESTPVGTRALTAELDSLVSYRGDLMSLRNDIDLAAQFAGTSIEVFSAASEGERISGSSQQTLLIFVVLGLVFGLGLAFALPFGADESKQKIISVWLKPAGEDH